ncbi:chromatin remodeling complex subunit [Niveomyces insectorum RCEF 264]|uniref:Chromatin remodeling complex subunit n=1 Tax=Niveomyces insectorum RCEF 264 TaxID=1081102 RepID=A0A167TYX7_9HYPO|nr:chromatin remodeling complex subunit [Niveomyces insectorum RCEF 264]
MAPQPGHTVDKTPEYLEFIETLREYHAKRGTNFEPEPKVGQVPVDLLKLFKLIVEHGGYDKISEEKLAWRNMVNLLELFSSNEASAAYSLKLAYYKNLAAYEISTVHKQEPPPPEILEHISAKGGNLLTRTLENFGGHRAMRPSSGAVDSGSGDDAMTPTRERRPDDGGGTPLSGRASRGLREAPPQRVIFQPDTSSSRQSRHGSGSGAHHHGHGSSPAAGAGHRKQQQQQQQHPMHPVHSFQQHHPLPLQQQQQQQHRRNASLVYNPPGAEFFSPTVQAYEPRGPVPIILQPVEAPGNAPGKFLQQQRLQRLQVSGVSLSRFATRPPVPPGNEGPNIYVRCLGALRSGLPAEEAFALSHLVKISFERGDKYKFESFPGLAEGLLDKALQVGSLFYHDIQWRISYDLDGTDEGDLGELDGVNGTPDILERIAQLRPKDEIDCIQTEHFADQLVLVTEAALTMRNMVTLQENAAFLSDFPPCRDFLCIVLHLPNKESVVELKHCALDIAEQLTPYLTLGDDDPLYQTLLQQLDSTDRGTVLTALRAVGRISMNMTQLNRLGRVPPSVLQSVTNWLLLNDDELMDACLDFLYQYTAAASNVERLLRSVQTDRLVSHLVRLLSHGARRSYKELVLRPERKLPPTEDVLPLPPDLLARLVATDEPERCYTWLRCFFEEDPDASITQIAIWQAYQSSFLQAVQQSGRTMLGAAEFIRNVTHVYHAAGAQIQKEQTPQGEVQKFIIKGIRPRVRPISPEGRPFFRCQWTMPLPSQPAHRCGVFFGSAERLYAHVLARHVGETPDQHGKVANKERACRCLWAGCHKYATATTTPLVDFMKHIKTHAVTAAGENGRPTTQKEQKEQKEQQKEQQREQQKEQQQAQPSSQVSQQPTTQPSPLAAAAAAGQPGHQRQRSSVTNGDLMAVSGQTPNGGGSSHKRQKRSYVVPAQTISVAYEETPTMRDERNPQLPPQAAGIPLSAVLVLRNIARNAAKAEVFSGSGGGAAMVDEQDKQEQRRQRQRQQQQQQPQPAPQQQQSQQPHAQRAKQRPSSLSLAASAQPASSSASSVSSPSGTAGAVTTTATTTAAAVVLPQEPGGWNERLFRPMLPRLYEIMTENRALASYIASLFQLIGEEW